MLTVLAIARPPAYSISAYIIKVKANALFCFVGNDTNPTNLGDQAASVNIISSISRGVTTNVFFGKCFKFPITRYASSVFAPQ